MNIVEESYKYYVYSVDIEGLPEWLKATGEVKSDDSDGELGSTYHHEFTLAGTPAAGEQTVTLKAIISLSSDNHVQILESSIDKEIKINVAEDKTLKGIGVSISGNDALNLTYGESKTQKLSAVVSGDYGEYGWEIITPESLTWSIKAIDGFTIDEDGVLTVAKTANANTYSVEVTATAKFGEFSKSATATVEVTISKADPEYTTPTGLTATYGQTLADVTLPSGWAWVDAATTKVGNVGTNTFKAQFTPTDTTNYNTPDPVEVTITVSKANATVDTKPTANTLSYTGSAQALVTAGSASSGTLQYALDDGEFSTAIPTATEAGSYTVKYRAVGNDNYADSPVGSLTVTIAKASSDGATIETGEPEISVTDGGYTTSKGTSFTDANGFVLSVDVAITTASDTFRAVSGSEFSTVISVDADLNIIEESYRYYAYSVDIEGLPDWLKVTGEVKSDDSDGELAKAYHHEFTLAGTPTTSAESVPVTLKAIISLSSDNHVAVFEASVDKEISIEVREPRMKPVLEVSGDISVVSVDLNEGRNFEPDYILVTATAGDSIVWTVSGDLPGTLEAESDDITLTLFGSISSADTKVGTYKIDIIATNAVGSADVSIAFAAYQIKTNGAVELDIDEESIAILQEEKEASGSSLTLSDLVDLDTINDALADSENKELVVPNGVQTLEGLSELTNLESLNLTEVESLTVNEIKATDLGDSVTEIKLGEKNTSVEGVDLTGSNVKSVEIEKSSVKTLTLGKDSKVTNINAKDSKELESIDFGNANVETVDISGTKIANADLGDCESLEEFTFDQEPESEEGDEEYVPGSLKILTLPKTGANFKRLAVRGQQLMWIGDLSIYDALEEVNVKGQRVNGMTIDMLLDIGEMLLNKYKEYLESTGETYVEGDELPFDIEQIGAGISYTASDDNSPQEAEIDDEGKIKFDRAPKDFRYNYDTRWNRGGRVGPQSVAAADGDDDEDGYMDVTISTSSVTGGTVLGSSSGGGCNAGLNFGALSALMLVFATLKKRR